MNLNTNLKVVLRRRGITAAELAKAIDCSPKTISDWLVGGRTPRDLEAVRRCAEYLDVSLHFLLFGEEDKQNVISNILEKTEIHTGLYEITVRKVKERKP